MSSTSTRLLSALLRAKSLNNLQTTPDTYFDDEDRAAFLFVRSFVERHNRWPSSGTIKRETGAGLVLTKEPLTYYMDEARKRALYIALNEPFKFITEAIQDQEPDRVIEIMRDCVTMASSLHGGRSSNLVSYSDSLDLVEEDYNIAKRTLGLRGVPTGYPYLDEVTDGLQNASMYTFVARTGVGKAQPNSERILLHDGTWVNFSDVAIGMKLASLDGCDNVINGVFPQGKRKVVKVTFVDGRQVRCDLDHLWQVTCDQWAQVDRTLTTRQLITALSRKRNTNRLKVPLFSGDFGHASLPIEPYSMGALLGDGGLSGPGLIFSSDDQEILTRFSNELRPGMRLTYSTQYDYRVQAGMLTRNPYIAALRKLGLFGHKSQTKFIPPLYMTGNRAQRLALLQGLMDTDGTVTETGAIEYSTSSPQLAQDVAALVRSLGGIAKIGTKETTHLLCYRVRVRLKKPSEAFHLSRKKRRCKDENQYSAGLGLAIKAIEYDGEEECTCVSVSHPSRLYITSNYTLTHNTTKLLKIAKAARDAGRSVLFLSMEMGVLQLARRSFSMDALIDPKFLRSGRLSTRVEQEMRRQKALLQESEMPPFYWLAGNFKKSVPALKAAVYECEPDLIVADAAYLMKSSDRPKGNAKHEMISDVMEDLADLFISVNRPGLVSVQFNRQAVKATRGGDDQPEQQSQRNPLAHLAVHKIAGSDAIAQISAVVAGLHLGDPPHQQDERYCGILKGREGEDGGWYKYHYKFRPPNFDQICDHRDYARITANRGPDLSYMDIQA